MKNCKNCKKELSHTAQYGKRTSLCITCFNKRRVGEKNPSWKGKNVGYGALHDWITKRFPRPKACQNCGKGFPIDLANISQKYKRDVNDFEWLCRKCHMEKDGRLNNLHIHLRRKHHV